MNKITFDTAKELNQYIRIETENYWYEFGNGEQKIIPRLPEGNNNIDYPAPTLEELLANSPIDLDIITSNDLRSILIRYYYNNQEKDIEINKFDSLVEAVAKIIIEYYKEKE